MPSIVTKIAHFSEMLPEQDQYFAYALIKKLVLAWDPDFSKLTAEEAKELEDSRSIPIDSYFSLDDI